MDMASMPWLKNLQNTNINTDSGDLCWEILQRSAQLGALCRHSNSGLVANACC